MRPARILAAVVAMSSVTHAISDAFDNIHGLADVKEVLFGRQDNNNNNNNNNDNNDNNDNKSTDAPASTPAPKPTGDNNNNNNNNSDNNDNKTSDNNDNKSGDNNDNKTASDSKETGTPTGKASGSKTTKKPTKSTTFDPRLPAGGITMVTPDALAGSQYYKVGDYITFAWNYTSLSVTPTAIDVLASCTANQATYTISVNMSSTETQVVWNTKETPEGQAPFLTENYQLLIYDANSTVTAPPRAGYLGAFSGFTFGMYLPQPYTSLQDGWTCPNCNAALSNLERMTLTTMLFTCGTTVGSLVYFTYQFGLW
ncbi:hypothetical protein J3E71DRAFT_241360 [Bipolaris maydis]|nr:hypothetical protein J3E71DRAFT_241360 [Bipolaris maydis]